MSANVVIFYLERPTVSVLQILRSLKIHGLPKGDCQFHKWYLLSQLPLLLEFFLHHLNSTPFRLQNETVFLLFINEHTCAGTHTHTHDFLRSQIHIAYIK